MLLPQWLMELSLFGWCNCHLAVGTPIMTAYSLFLLLLFVADGITTYLADVIANMADGIAICMYRLE